jgi:TPR repeat protein
MRSLQAIAALLFILLSMPTMASKRVAVLEFQGVGVPNEVLLLLSDQSRESALNSLGDEYSVITRENMLEIMRDLGKDLSCVEGECEVVIARNIGADLVVSGTVTLLDGIYFLNLKLHETTKGRLLSSRTSEAEKASALVKKARSESEALFTKLAIPPDAQPLTQSTGAPIEKETAQASLSVEALAYQKDCMDGDAAACTNLGFSYSRGEGTPLDHEEKVYYYRKACEAGSMVGCNNLGVSYRDGKGVEKNPVKAIEHYQMACSGGSMIACNNLGVSHKDGEGTPQSYKQAKKYYEMACNGGGMAGCTNLGLRYENGQGVEQDHEKAVYYYRKACEGIEIRGCAYWGDMLLNGKGVTADPTKAAALLGDACKKGDLWACRHLPK